ncbi:hypothetical protein ACVGXE_00485, partial [Escherichia coli]
MTRHRLPRLMNKNSHHVQNNISQPSLFRQHPEKNRNERVYYTHLRAHETVQEIWYGVFCLKIVGGGGGGGGG